MRLPYGEVLMEQPWRTMQVLEFLSAIFGEKLKDEFEKAKR
jgi:hypothetical protein